MLKWSDAALLIGDEALHEQELNKNSFDLGEEWYDLTGLPMVFSFWTGRQIATQIEDVKNIINSTNLGLKNLENIAKEYSKKTDFSWALYHDYLTQNVNYKFTEEEHAGLTEFYNYAFYYGLIEYIPDILFFEI
jgi:chorismate dehydratase